MKTYKQLREELKAAKPDNVSEGLSIRKRTRGPAGGINYSWSSSKGFSSSITIGNTTKKKGGALTWNSKRGYTYAIRGTGIRYTWGAPTKTGMNRSQIQERAAQKRQDKADQQISKHLYGVNSRDPGVVSRMYSSISSAKIEDSKILSSIYNTYQEIEDNEKATLQQINAAIEYLNDTEKHVKKSSKDDRFYYESKRAAQMTMTREALRESSILKEMHSDFNKQFKTGNFPWSSGFEPYFREVRGRMRLSYYEYIGHIQELYSNVHKMSLQLARRQAALVADEIMEIVESKGFAELSNRQMKDLKLMIKGKLPHGGVNPKYMPKKGEIVPKEIIQDLSVIVAENGGGEAILAADNTLGGRFNRVFKKVGFNPDQTMDDRLAAHLNPEQQSEKSPEELEARRNKLYADMEKRQAKQPEIKAAQQAKIKAEKDEAEAQRKQAAQQAEIKAEQDKIKAERDKLEAEAQRLALANAPIEEVQLQKLEAMLQSDTGAGLQTKEELKQLLSKKREKVDAKDFKEISKKYADLTGYKAANIGAAINKIQSLEKSIIKSRLRMFDNTFNWAKKLDLSNIKRFEKELAEEHAFLKRVISDIKTALNTSTNEAVQPKFNRFNEIQRLLK